MKSIIPVSPVIWLMDAMHVKLHRNPVAIRNQVSDTVFFIKMKGATFSKDAAPFFQYIA